MIRKIFPLINLSTYIEHLEFDDLTDDRDEIALGALIRSASIHNKVVLAYKYHFIFISFFCSSEIMNCWSKKNVRMSQFARYQ